MCVQERNIDVFQTPEDNGDQGEEDQEEKDQEEKDQEKQTEKQI